MGKVHRRPPLTAAVLLCLSPWLLFSIVLLFRAVTGIIIAGLVSALTFDNPVKNYNTPAVGLSSYESLARSKK